MSSSTLAKYRRFYLGAWTLIVAAIALGALMTLLSAPPWAWIGLAGLSVLVGWFFGAAESLRPEAGP